MKSIVRVVLASGAAWLFCACAQAQMFRAYVASSGNDSNPCTVVAPCRLLPAALNAVAPGGEIWMLDSANYNAGTVNIAKDVTILAIPGAVGSIVAVGGNAAVNITSGRVAFRNVVVTANAVNPGFVGINVAASGLTMVTVEDSSFSNLNNSGIAATGTMDLNLKNVVFRDANTGINIADGPTVNLSGVHIFRADEGLTVQGNAASSTTLVHIADSEIAGLGIIAIVAGASNNATVKVVAENTRIYNGGGGVFANADSPAALTVVLNGVSITATGTGVQQSGTGSVVKTFGNNNISENGTDVNGTLTPAAPK